MRRDARIGRTDFHRMLAVGRVHRVRGIGARGERRLAAERRPARMQRDTDQQPGRQPRERVRGGAPARRAALHEQCGRGARQRKQRLQRIALRTVMRESFRFLRIGLQALEHLAPLVPGQFAIQQRGQQLRRRVVVLPVRRLARIVHHGFPITRNVAVPCAAGASVSNARICARARASRDITVPTGTPSTFAASR